MTSKDPGKSVRIGLACNACRSKKHRCSGEKPRCAQCTSTNTICTWPIQQKRGPPKHYTNSLEARLFETEAVLLSLLSHVSTEQLRASFQSIPPTSRAFRDPNEEIEQNTEQLAFIKQHVFRPAYWNSFPLDSEENVLRWWEDRTSRTSAGQRRNDFISNPASQELSESDAQSSGLPEPGDIISDSSGLLPHSNFAEQIQMVPTEVDVEASLHRSDQGGMSNHQYANVQQETSRLQSEAALSASNKDSSENTLARDGSRDNIMQISDQFKEDFLW